MSAIYLENVAWTVAETLLQSNALFVIPLGSALKQHGKHLPLNNDKLLAEFLTVELSKSLDIVVLPTVAASFYPAFVDYPGTVSLSLETATSLIAETCISLARHGCRRIYVLNTGFSTKRILENCQKNLAVSNPDLKFHYTDFKAALAAASGEIERQQGGGHADEIETSIMLYMAPDVVKMENAELDFHGDAAGPLSRDISAIGAHDRVYSPTGAWGDPTLATREKGELIVSRLVEYLREDISRFLAD